MSEAKWYAVHTYTGYENKVAKSLATTVENRRLHELIQDVKIPTEIEVEIKDGKRKEKENIIYPSYVFVKMVLTDDTWYIVRNTRGVTGFLGSSPSKPSPLSDKEVEQMGVEVRTQTIDFKVGDHVQIIDGPLADIIGMVEALDADNETVTVKVSMFGRETSTELGIFQVKPI